jgi:hypothetical protein
VIIGRRNPSEASETNEWHFSRRPRRSVLAAHKEQPLLLAESSSIHSESGQPSKRTYLLISAVIIFIIMIVIVRRLPRLT